MEFSWFMLGSNKIVPFNYPLKTSIFYWYFRRIYDLCISRKITQIGNYKIRPSYPLVIGDLIIHQIPMATVLYLTYKGECKDDKQAYFGYWPHFLVGYY